MEGLFRAIQESHDHEKRMIFTALDKENLADKALMVDGKMVWERKENGFFCAHEEQLANWSECGVGVLDGKSIFCEMLGEEMRVVICGGGHVSIPVIQLGVMMGWHVTVLEDRPLYADRARRAGATEVICESFGEGLDQIEGSLGTYFVIVTRGHRYDQECLEKIAGKEHAYIGMIGSRRRTTIIRKNLLEKGIDQEILNAVHTPIGLDIGAKTPVEIAVAIVAEIIELKNKKKSTFGYPGELVEALCQEKDERGTRVLATIITREGSAPQGIGTKMLIYQNESCVGTIGGGCMEARIIQRARLMAVTEGLEAEICCVDLTGADAEEEGMVCGGVINVLLEKIS